MGMSYSAPGRMVAHNMVTTQFELDGFRVVRTLGVVRGIVVRSRSIFGTIGQDCKLSWEATLRC